MAVAVRAISGIDSASLSVTTQSGDMILIGGVTGDPTGASPGASPTWNGSGMTGIISVHQGNDTWCLLSYILNPDLGSYTLAANPNGDLGTVATFACIITTGAIMTNPLSARDTCSSQHSLNDFLNCDLSPTVQGDLCVYLGRKETGSPSWSGVDAQTSEYRNSRLAYEVATSTTASATWGAAGDSGISCVGFVARRGLIKNVGVMIG